MRLPRFSVDTGEVVTSVATSPYGSTFLSTGFKESNFKYKSTDPRCYSFISVWNIRTGKLIRSFPACEFRSDGIAVSPRGTVVIASGETAGYTTDTVTAWDWSNGKKLWSHQGNIPLCFSPDGEMVGTGNTVLNARNGKQIYAVPTAVEEDRQCKFSPDGKLFCTVKFNYRWWHGATHDNIYTHTPISDVPIGIQLWDSRTGKALKTVPPPIKLDEFQGVSDFAFDPSGQSIYLLCNMQPVMGVDGAIFRDIDVKTGHILWLTPADPNDLYGIGATVVVSPNGRYVVVDNIDDGLRVLDAKTGGLEFHASVPHIGDWRIATALHRKFRAVDYPQNWSMPGGIAFSPDGKMLVSRFGEHVEVWDSSSLN